MTPEMKKKLYWGGALAAGTVGVISVIALWPKKAAAGMPVAFLPSKAPAQPVSLTRPYLLKEGDNGAFLLQPTRDFFWVKIPPDIIAVPGAGDLEMFTGDFQPSVQKREEGQVYLMIPPGTSSGSRGATSLTIGTKDRNAWATVVIVTVGIFTGVILMKPEKRKR